jgi:hypothetical protein
MGQQHTGEGLNVLLLATVKRELIKFKTGMELPTTLI